MSGGRKTHITKSGRKSKNCETRRKKTFFDFVSGSLKLISAFSPFLLEFHLLLFRDVQKGNPLDAGIDFILFSISFNCHHILSSFDSRLLAVVVFAKYFNDERTESLIKDAVFR